MVVFVYITNTFCLLQSSMFNTARMHQFRIKYWRKICNFISLYRSPGQFHDEFEKFIENLELNLERLCQNNPFLIVLIGDLHTKQKNWCCHDKSSLKENAMENVTAQFGLQQKYHLICY